MSKLFISYRRSDAEDATGRIYDRLVGRYGRQNVFKDVDSIPPGVDFRDHVKSSILASQVMLVIIGRGWLNARNEQEQQRLNNPEDFVRIEIETALKAPGMVVIPVLVGRANMPPAQDLPPSLQKLVYLNASQVRPDPDFSDDLQDLIEGLNPYMGSGWNRLQQRIPTKVKWLGVVSLFVLMAALIAVRFYPTSLSQSVTKVASDSVARLRQPTDSGLDEIDTKRLVAAYYAAKPRLLDDRILNEVVTVAFTQFAKKEDSTSNKGPRIDKYLKSIGMGPGFGWSQAFVYWCFEQATKKYNQPNPILKTGSITMFVANAEKQNIHMLSPEEARNNPALIRPGMVFCVSRANSSRNDYVHVGIVIKAQPDFVETVEGNTGTEGQNYGTGVFLRKRNVHKTSMMFIDYSHQQD